MWVLSFQEKRFLQSISLITLLCMGLFFVRALLTGHLQFVFIPGNLALAWMALFVSWLLVKQLLIYRWLSWQIAALLVIWLIFLPNSWYVMTDFIHVVGTGEISRLFDIVLISSLVFCGFTLGFASLYLIHSEIRKKLSEAASGVIMASVILVSSFAIYLGRDLRLNTWDVIAHPEGLIVNVSDRVLDPLGNPRALNVTLLFFFLIGSLYLAVWLYARPGSKSKSR